MRSYIDEDCTGKVRYYVHDCPFCGSKNTDLYQVQVKCERCGAHGPIVSEDVWPTAITLWNKLPRKEGDELEKLRRHWSAMTRRIRLAEKRARIEYSRNPIDEKRWQ